MKRYLYDIETNALLDEVTTIWCVVIQDLDTREVWKYRPDEIKEALVKLSEADYISGHNIIAYDNRVLKKLYNWVPRPEVIIFDTLVACRTIWPHINECDVTFRAQLKRKGFTMPSYLFTNPHSLKSWSYRISGGDPSRSKFHYDDWSKFTEEMLVYCIQDVSVNCDLWDYITKKNFSERALALEMKAHYWFLKMEEIGMPFDVQAASDLYSTLEETRLDIRDRLVAVVPPTVVVMKTKTKQIPFNPGSRKQIATFLIDNGWKPTKFTKGKDGVVSDNPTVDEETLEEAAEILGESIPEVKLLFEYLILSKRIGQLATGKQAWLKMERDGIIHGRTNHMGCVTSRVSHKYPNMGQVPATKYDENKQPLPYWGPEYRRMFYAPSGYALVGADASGLELRCLGHYMGFYDGGAYAKIVVEGDVHTTNQQAAGLATRNNAKTFIYGFLYGAGDEKIGSIVGKDAKEGKRLKAKFLKGLPALGKLRDGVTLKAKTTKKLRMLDDRYTPIRAAHSSLNTLLQGCGAIICKTWLVLICEEIERRGLDASVRLFIHDEVQIIVREDQAEEVAQITKYKMKEVEKLFNLKCPLDSDFKIGKNWSETH